MDRSCHATCTPTATNQVLAQNEKMQVIIEVPRDQRNKLEYDKVCLSSSDTQNTVSVSNARAWNLAELQGTITIASEACDMCMAALLCL